MSDTAILGARILSGGQWLDDHALVISMGRITEIVPIESISADLVLDSLDGGYLIPGFIDTQVNGGGGVLFNDMPTLEGVITIAAAHCQFGTTALLPTLISDDRAVIESGIAAVEEAMRAGVPGVVGIHIEGPFLNPAKHGIHDATKIQTLDSHAVDLLASLRGGKTLVTLAPECIEPELIRALTKRGVVVSAGHSLASFEEMSRAVAEGLTGVTHLFNAMSQLASREPGVVGAAIDLGLVSGLIVDGHHVHPAALRAAYRAMGPEKLMLVTDAMPSVGSANKGFALGQNWISKETGALRGLNGTLAGSDLNMGQAMRNAITMMEIDLAQASRMASETPALFLGLAEDFGRLAAGQRADIVHLNEALIPQRIWIGGEER